MFLHPAFYVAQQHTSNHRRQDVMSTCWVVCLNKMVQPGNRVSLQWNVVITGGVAHCMWQCIGMDCTASRKSDRPPAWKILFVCTCSSAATCVLGPSLVWPVCHHPSHMLLCPVLHELSSSPLPIPFSQEPTWPNSMNVRVCTNFQAKHGGFQVRDVQCADILAG